MPNRLKKASSPYLRQHADNPVDWYPWGDEALDRAKRENRPIFLSVGYAACHWCHVMEKESFSNDEVAEIMNKWFVNIKVDREERPDIDHIYMAAVQALTQQGGWPMSVFLTPNLEPFYGGTYFPPEDSRGMSGFKKVLKGVAVAWKTKPDDIGAQAANLTNALKQMEEIQPVTAGETLNATLIDTALDAYRQSFDSENGGFGTAPKFFHVMDLQMCLRRHHATGSQATLALVTTTLDSWARGGIYDVVGGGFHRYATDPKWRIPHFEKMLYDNALVSRLYLEGYQVTGKVPYAAVSRHSLSYVVEDLTHPHGGYFSSRDADSEGEEGKYYVWTEQEIRDLLEPDVADTVVAAYGVTKEGNWEGKNILQMPLSWEETVSKLQMDDDELESTLAVAIRQLKDRRQEREAPFRDEKILAGWNGLMLSSLARGYLVLGDEGYLQSATESAERLWTELWKEPVLHHGMMDDIPMGPGFLEDYAHLGLGYLDLYQATGDAKWLERSYRLTTEVLNRFCNNDHFFMTEAGLPLLTRPRENQDGAMPSGASSAVLLLLSLGHLVGETKWQEQAERAILAQVTTLKNYPQALGQLLLALDLQLAPPRTLVIAPGKEPDDAFEQWFHSEFRPHALIGWAKPSFPNLAQKPAEGGKTTAYLCEGSRCGAPATDPESLKAQWKSS